jgi:hypothetical protein
VLGVMSDGNWIRGVTVPSHIVMWVTWQWNTWHIDIWHVDIWHVDTWQSIGGTYHSRGAEHHNTPSGSSLVTLAKLELPQKVYSNSS